MATKNIKGDEAAQQIDDPRYALGRLASYRKSLLVDITTEDFVVPDDFYCRGIMHEGANTEDLDIILSEESASQGARLLDPRVPYAFEVKTVVKATTAITAKIWVLA